MDDVFPEGHVFAGLRRRAYRVLYLDPPWRFSGGKGKGSRNCELHYRTMSDAEIGALPIAELAHPDGAWVFCWATGPKLPHAFVALKAWKAKYSGLGFTWVKLHKRFGRGGRPLFMPPDAFHVSTGYTTRKNTEPCLLAKFGKPKRISKCVHELIVAPLREHSRKPEEARDRIERFAEGPYVELFNRHSREGWDTWGDQAGLFDEASARKASHGAAV